MQSIEIDSNFGCKFVGMSTQMPSLFDELEFFGPKPQKEVKKTKKKETKPSPEPLEEKETYPNDVQSGEESLVAEREQGEYSIEESQGNKLAENENSTSESNLEKETLKEEVFEKEDAQNEKEENIEDKKEVESQNSFDKEPETIALATSSNLHISFEAPEEETNFFTGNDLEEASPNEVEDIENVGTIDPLPIPGIKKEKVDDLDNLLISSIISQDYALYAGLEVPKDKKDQQNSANLEQEVEEKESLNISAEKSSNLDFEFDQEAPLHAETLPEFDLEDKYYTIGEVATLFNVNVSHIRFWTTEFKLKVRTTRKGDRLYNPENIARLRLIHHLVKENGFTIKGAKEKLKLQKSNVSSQVDLKEKLTGLREKLERIKRNL